MQRKSKIAAALLAGISTMPILHACATTEKAPDYEVCSDNDADATNDCPEMTSPVVVE